MMRTALCLILSAFWFGVSYPAELLPNGGFERDFTGWSNIRGAEIVSDPVASGVKAVRAFDAGVGHEMQFVIAPTLEQRSAILSAKVRSGSGSGPYLVGIASGCYIRLMSVGRDGVVTIYDENLNLLGTFNVSVNGQYDRIGIPVQIPAGQAAGVVLQLDYGEWFVDDVSLREIGVGASR